MKFLLQITNLNLINTYNFDQHSMHEIILSLLENTYIHTYIHTYTYTHIHTQNYSCSEATEGMGKLAWLGVSVNSV
jgi:hypothetical protein